MALALKDWRNYLIILLTGASIGGPAGTILAGVDEKRAREIAQEESKRSGEVTDVKLHSLEQKVDSTNKAVEKLDAKVDQVLDRLPRR